MPRRNWNDGQEITFEDLNAVSSALERTIYDRLFYRLLQKVEDAFLDDSLLVEYATATSVTVRSGVGFQSDGTQTSPEPNKRLIYNDASATQNIAAPDASLDRIDIISVKAAIADELTESRKFKDEITEVVTDENLVVQKDWEASFVVTAGTPHASPSVPSTPTGYIKLAELDVTAVTGLAGGGAVTDKRTLLPMAGEMLLNTLGYNRLTAGATTSVITLMGEIDALLKNGYQEYTDMDDLSSDPDAPLAASDKIRMYIKDGVLYGREQAPGGVVIPLGGGGGGGGGAIWNPPDGFSPIEDEENDEKVWRFPAGGDQKLVIFMKVPESFITGRQIKMYCGMYCESSSNNFLFRTTAYLIRENLDAVTATANSHVSTNSALTNTVANQYRNVELDITDSVGKINSFAVDHGDLLRIEISRGTDTDTEDARLIPSTTEMKYT